MKFKNIGLVLGLFFCGSAFAGPCVVGTLSSYIALGGTGCTIDGVTVGSFQILSGITGSTAIDPLDIDITPGGSTNNPSLTFVVDEVTNFSLLEAIFNYTISGPAFSQTAISLTGNAEVGDGAVTYIQNYCAGGQFGPDGVTGCSGSATGALLALDGIQNTDQAAIAGATLLSITDDYTLDPGPAGAASGGTFADQFTATAATSGVPEPGAFGLVGIGIACAAIAKRARR